MYLKDILEVAGCKLLHGRDICMKAPNRRPAEGGHISESTAPCENDYINEIIPTYRTLKVSSSCVMHHGQVCYYRVFRQRNESTSRKM